MELAKLFTRQEIKKVHSRTGFWKIATLIFLALLWSQAMYLAMFGLTWAQLANSDLYTQRQLFVSAAVTRPGFLAGAAFFVRVLLHFGPLPELRMRPLVLWCILGAIIFGILQMEVGMYILSWLGINAGWGVASWMIWPLLTFILSLYFVLRLAPIRPLSLP